LPIIFTSGITHYAEIPEGMAKAPDYVKAFITSIPSVWDDTKFIDGWPGKFVVLARKGNGKWFLAGINGDTTEQKLTLDLSELRGAKSGQLISDGDGGNLSFKQQPIQLPHDKKLEITLPPHGGFVAVFN